MRLRKKEGHEEIQAVIQRVLPARPEAEAPSAPGRAARILYAARGATHGGRMGGGRQRRGPGREECEGGGEPLAARERAVEDQYFSNLILRHRRHTIRHLPCLTLEAQDSGER